MADTKLILGECLTELKKLNGESVNCCVTSPPYWALRDYGVDGQLGLEHTFQEYIDKLCDIFDEVKRVLKKDGTCWVNLGDTYGGSGKGAGGYSNKSTLQGYTGEHTKGRTMAKENWNFKKAPKTENDVSKSLCQIPSRFSIEMCNRGWILRNEIIWHKPNSMPSSVKDRFTVDFEKLFLFVKNKKYWFETQREPHQTEEWKTRNMSKRKKNDSNKQYQKHSHGPQYYHPEGRNKRTVWEINTKPYKGAHFAVFPEELIKTPIKAGCPKGGIVLDPFCGSGTTGVVAKKQGKEFIGIELNPEYIEMAKQRIANTQESMF